MIGKLIRAIFPEFNRPLSEYDLPSHQRPRAVAPTKGPKVDEQGFAGAWKDSQHYEAVNVSLAGKKAGTALDTYDLAALADKFGAKWGSDQEQAKAQEIKRHWEKGLSASEISKAKGHARGWSDRSIDPYIAALYQAKAEREAQRSAK
jgi:hypothetical protein